MTADPGERYAATDEQVTAIDETVVGARKPIARYIPVTLVGPLIGASLGIDGGAIFQILAVENLGLSAAAIGIAFGLGVVSVPIQLYAARIPIEHARRNIQIFLALAAVQAWILAVLVAVGATDGFAVIALAVTVTAEVSLSVLFATAWQPLLATGLDTIDRQRLNSTWPAVARAMLAAALVLFSALHDEGRTLFLVIVGALAIVTAFGLNSIDAPDPITPSPSGSKKATRALAPATRIVLLVFAAINIGALPLWLVYLNQVLWPTANLGVIAAVQTLASMAALLAWRATDGDITGRALLAAIATLAAAAAVLPLSGPLDSRLEYGTVFAVTAVMAIGATTVRIAMLEAAHRVVTPANTVRAFTLLDVVASTALQAGLLISGFLITASIDTSTLGADPYRVFVVAASATTIPAILWFKKASANADPHQHRVPTRAARQ